MPQKSINELHKFHSQFMSAALDKHFHRFFGDFDALLAEHLDFFEAIETGFCTIHKEGFESPFETLNTITQ
jgi:hypothetical protein